jgi:hypothetical protein
MVFIPSKVVPGQRAGNPSWFRHRMGRDQRDVAKRRVAHYLPLVFFRKNQQYIARHLVEVVIAAL